MNRNNEISSADRLDPLTLTKAGLIFLIACLFYFLARSPGLDDYDSVQFAMGVGSFDVWHHQPHPPGYPLYIALGKVGVRLLGTTPELSLHFVSALGGALFIAAWFLIIRLQFNERLAWWLTACLAITPVVWMTSTKVLTDSLATGFLSAEILAALYFSRRGGTASLLTAALFGAAASGARPQLILVAAVILVVALRRRRAPAKMAVWVFGGLFCACLLWLLPTWYLQWRLRPAVPLWLVYPKLIYSQWVWRLDKPHAYIGAGDWSVSYLATRFGSHFGGWFGIGFGLLRSPIAFVAGTLILGFGLVTYFSRRREAEDRQFWQLHAPWALVHIVIIFAFLPSSPRYYLIIFPLLLVVLLRGYLRMSSPFHRLALALPCFLLAVLAPSALENHRDEAPPVQLVRYLANRYPASERSNVALLFINARRHAEWYAPGFMTFAEVPPASELPRILKEATAVYADDEKVALPAGWKRVPLEVYHRSLVIYPKYHTLHLFLIERNDAS